MEKTSSVAKENLSPGKAVPSRGQGWAFAALVAGNIALAVAALFVRYADTGPVATGFWRMALAAPLLWLLARYFGQSVRGLPPKTLWLVALGGLFFAADIAAWHMGILLTKLGNATLFGNSASLLLVAYGLILTRRWPKGQTLAAIMLATLGALLLMGKSYQASRDYLIGDLLSLLAGVLYTGYVIALQRARGEMGSWAVLALATTACALPLLLFAAALGEQIMPTNWTPLILLAVTAQLIGQGFLIYALPHFSALIIGLALLIQPAIAALAGWLKFGEQMGPVEIIGAVMVSLALALVRTPEKT